MFRSSPRKRDPAREARAGRRSLDSRVRGNERSRAPDAVRHAVTRRRAGAVPNCALDIWRSHAPSFRRSRVCSASLRFAACCAAPGTRRESLVKFVMSKAPPALLFGSARARRWFSLPPIRGRKPRGGGAPEGAGRHLHAGAWRAQSRYALAFRRSAAAILGLGTVASGAGRRGYARSRSRRLSPPFIRPRPAH
jgi:hypothetical protein